MTERIYHLGQQGELEPMVEEPFAEEDLLQALVADHPELLSGEQINPAEPRRWILIRREQGIPKTEGGGNYWAVDHLLIDQDAVPTLVEVKRSANSEIRRTIVGQMLDYAAHATRTWDVGDIRRSFEESSEDPDDVLAKLLQSDSDLDAEEFWQRVETNLRAARMRLLFVADRIPDELTRVVEFLNEHMREIEVLAVEIKQFLGETGQTLVPRVIGRTAAADPNVSSSRRRVRLDRRTFIDSLPGEQVQQAAHRLFEVADRYNCVFSWERRAVSIRKRCPAWTQPVSVAWFYVPSYIGWMGGKEFSFGAGTGDRDFFERLPVNLRVLLESWADQFSQGYNATGISHPNIKGWSIPYEDAVANIDAVVERLENILRSLQQLEAPLE